MFKKKAVKAKKPIKAKKKTIIDEKKDSGMKFREEVIIKVTGKDGKIKETRHIVK